MNNAAWSPAISRASVLSSIRSMLGYNSTASRDAIKTAVAGDNDANREIVAFVIDEMIADGGLQYSERGWLYCPCPATGGA